jgi:hypothetical protein
LGAAQQALLAPVEARVVEIVLVENSRHGAGPRCRSTPGRRCGWNLRARGEPARPPSLSKPSAP